MQELRPSGDLNGLLIDQPHFNLKALQIGIVHLKVPATCNLCIFQH